MTAVPGQHSAISLSLRPMPPPSSMYMGDILFPERPQPSSKMKNKNNGRNGVAIYRTMLKESMCQHYESFEK